MFRRIAAVFSALALVAGLIPLPALATGGLVAATSGKASYSVAAAVDNEKGNAALTTSDAESGGNAFYVATGGSDDSAGTIDAPFRTIAHAASVMRAGDTCYIRGGTYRELLSDHQRQDRNGHREQPTIPKLKGTQAAPFTFQAYGDEKVTLTGTDPVTGWTRVDAPASASVWRAAMDWDMYLGQELGSGTPLPAGQEEGIANGNLVFADGNPCLEGRWPNAYAEAPATAACGIPDSIMDLDRYARTDAGTGTVNSKLRVVDAGLETSQASSALPQGTNLAGAQLWCTGGDAYDSLLWLINEHDTATGTLTLDPLGSPSYFNPRPDNIFYVTRSLSLVDQPGEWYKDVKNKQLYLCVGEGEDPNDMTIEAKRRTYAIDFGESSYVTFKGIDVRGGTVSFMGYANHCTLTQAEVSATDVCQGPTTSSAEWRQTNGFGRADGVMLGGTFNAVTRCDFHDLYGEAVKLEESDNFFVNNLVRCANIENSGNSAGIMISGKRHMVSHNTVALVGRLALGGSYEASEVCYNDLSHAMRLSRDGGIIYANVHDYENSAIHHNLMHDSRIGDGYRSALYFDPLVNHLLFHHNVIYNAEDDVFDNTWDSAINGRKSGQKKSFTLSPFGMHLIIANNTFVNTFPISISQGDRDPVPDYGGSLLANNLFRSAIADYLTPDLQNFGWTLTNNLGGTQEPRADSSGADGDFVFHYREGDFANAAAYDYTLKAGSEAIDGGVAIPGITDGFSGSSPDVGAFESGQAAWSAGCDLTRDFALEPPVTGGVPASDALVNGTFESFAAGHPWEASTDTFQLTGWTQTGGLTHYCNSSWSYYGEISGDGIYLVQMRSNSKLSQKVSGLKPNTVYAVAGYGRVASDYVPGNAAQAGWDKDGNALASVAPQSRIGDARMLQFEDLDFGATGADRLIVGISGAGAVPANAGLIVRVRLDGRGEDGTVAGELKCGQWHGYGGRQEWLTVEFDHAVTGVHDVYLEFDTKDLEGVAGKNPNKIGDGQLYGVLFANSRAEDTLTIAAKVAGGTSAELVCRESRFTRPQRHAYVRTGADGVIDVEVTKTGAQNSPLLGYVDTLSLYEVFPKPGEVRLPDAKLLESVAAQLDAQGVAYLREGDGTLQMAGNDIVRVTSLDLSGAGIESLEGIESLTSLERIDVTGNHISDLSPLAGIEGLEVVGASEQAPKAEEAGTDEPGGEGNEPGSEGGEGGGGSESGEGSEGGEGGEGEPGGSDNPGEPGGSDNPGTPGGSDSSGTPGGSDNPGSTPGSNTEPDSPAPVSRDLAAAEVSLAGYTFTFNGAEHRPRASVRYGSEQLVEGRDYALSYEDNLNAGTATVRAAGLGAYAGAKSVSFRIAKAETPLRVTSKKASVKRAFTKRWSVLRVVVAVRGAQGTLAYSKAGGSKRLSVDERTGKVLVKRGTKRGTYRAKVKVKAAGTANYRAATRIVRVTVKVV